MTSTGEGAGMPGEYPATGNEYFDYLLNGQKTIPDKLTDLTDCGKYVSDGRCQFGMNWNDYKREIIRKKKAAAAEQGKKEGV